MTHTLTLDPEAFKKVRDRLPIPTTCRYCSGPVVLAHNSEVYATPYEGDWPWVYRCIRCDARVGLHTGTDLPLGTLADGKTRLARRMAKGEFNKLWKSHAMSRNTAYRRLAAVLKIHPRECHISMMDEDVCYLVCAVVPYILDPTDDKRRLNLKDAK